jgi:magnesium-transporting ATPase (P-type)
MTGYKEKVVMLINSKQASNNNSNSPGFFLLPKLVLQEKRNNYNNLIKHIYFPAYQSSINVTFRIIQIYKLKNKRYLVNIVKLSHSIQLQQVPQMISKLKMKDLTIMNAYL